MLVVKLYSETVHILSQMSESFDVGSHNNEPGMSLHHERSTYETFFYKRSCDFTICIGFSIYEL